MSLVRNYFLAVFHAQLLSPATKNSMVALLDSVSEGSIYLR